MRHPGGFSFMEVLIAMVLLVGVSVLALSSFSSTTKVQQSANNVASNLSREMIEEAHEEVRRDWYDVSSGVFTHTGKLTGAPQAAKTLNNVTFNRSVTPVPVDIDGDGAADYHRLDANVQWSQ